MSEKDRIINTNNFKNAVNWKINRLDTLDVNVKELNNRSRQELVSNNNEDVVKWINKEKEVVSSTTKEDWEYYKENIEEGIKDNSIDEYITAYGRGVIGNKAEDRKLIYYSMLRAKKIIKVQYKKIKIEEGKYNSLRNEYMEYKKAKEKEIKEKDKEIKDREKMGNIGDNRIKESEERILELALSNKEYKDKIKELESKVKELSSKLESVEKVKVDIEENNKVLKNSLIEKIEEVGKLELDINALRIKDKMTESIINEKKEQHNWYIPRTRNEEKVKLAIDMYREGKKVSEIAQEIKKSETTVRTYLKDEGLIERREKSGKPRVEINTESLKTMVDAKLTLKEISLALGVSVGTVSNRIRELN